MKNNRDSSDLGSNSRSQKRSNLPNELDIAMNIAKTHLEVKIKGEDARVAQGGGTINTTGVSFGEILAEMVYGNGDMKALVQEF
jgi:hypothetical protein